MFNHKNVSLLIIINTFSLLITSCTIFPSSPIAFTAHYNTLLKGYSFFPSTYHRILEWFGNNPERSSSPHEKTSSTRKGCSKPRLTQIWVSSVMIHPVFSLSFEDYFSNVYSQTPLMSYLLIQQLIIRNWLQLKFNFALHAFWLVYLLLEIVSLEAALARPLTPAVLAGSMLLLLDCVLNLPHVLGFKLAKKEDLGDWVVVGLFAEKKKRRQNYKDLLESTVLLQLALT